MSGCLLVRLAYGESPDSHATSNDIALIQTLVKENLANLAKIKSFRLEFEKSSGGNSNLPLPNGKAGTTSKTTAHGLILHKGDWYRSDYRTKIEYTDQSFRQENHQMAVLNDAEFFQVLETGDSISAASYEHYSLADRSSIELEAAKRSDFAHPFQHGFARDYPYDVSDRLGKWVDLTKWTVAEDRSNGDHLYHVTSIVEKTERRTLTFNASKGYLITSVKREDPNGKKVYEIEVVPTRVNGIWVPKQVDETDSQNGTFMRLRTVTAEINTTIPDSEFQPRELTFDRSKVRLARFAPGISRPTAMVYLDDRWIPENYLGGEDGTPSDSARIGDGSSP